MLPIFLLFVIATLYNLALVIVLLLNTHPRQSGKPFAWFIFWVALWMACCAVIMCPAVSREMTVLFARASYFCATAFLISHFRFCLSFPTPSGRFRRIGWVVTLGGLPWLFLAWGPLTVVGVDRYPWSENIRVGPALPWYALWLLFTALSAITHLLVKGRHTRGIERLQLRYMLLGFISMLLGGGICDILLPILTHTSRFAPLGPFSSLFMTSMTTYAIVRYRLLDIRIVLRAGLIYSITVGLLSALFALLVPLLDHIVVRLVPISSHAAGFAIALSIALLFSPLRRRVQAVLDRAFFKSVYDYRQALRESSIAFAAARESSVLSEILRHAVTCTLHAAGIAIYLPNARGSVLARKDDGTSWHTLPGSLAPGDLLYRYAERRDDVLLAEELALQGGEDAAVGRQLLGWQVKVVTPMVAGNTFCGLLLLGEKRSGDVYTVDDIGLLRILSKQAAVALENAAHYDTLKHVNTQLEERVGERTAQLAAANAQLAQANAALTAADRAKDEFLAVLSHELKTPLTCVLAWAEIAQREQNPTLTTRAIDVIIENALRQRHLLNDLLDISRIIHQKMLLRVEPTDLWELAQQSVKTLEQLAWNKRIHIDCDAPAEAMPILADPDRVIQVIINVIENALKFTDAGGTVSLTGFRSAGEAHLLVSDTGRGIAPEILTEIFSPFRQLERIEPSGGLGLGLALVQGITALHGGSVTAASAGSGKGSTFHIAFPLTGTMNQETDTTSACAPLPDIKLGPSVDGPESISRR